MTPNSRPLLRQHRLADRGLADFIKQIDDIHAVEFLRLQKADEMGSDPKTAASVIDHAPVGSNLSRAHEDLCRSETGVPEIHFVAGRIDEVQPQRRVGRALADDAGDLRHAVLRIACFGMAAAKSGISCVGSRIELLALDGNARARDCVVGCGLFRIVGVFGQVGYPKQGCRLHPAESCGGGGYVAGAVTTAPIPATSRAGCAGDSWASGRPEKPVKKYEPYLNCTCSNGSFSRS